jgi:hypothetical protein
VPTIVTSSTIEEAIGLGRTGERNAKVPEPASPTGTELMPSDNLDPAMTSWEAHPSQEEPYAAMALTPPNRPAAVAMRAR